MTNSVTPIQGSVWTFEDYTERRCMLSDVGHERYDPGYAKRVAQRHTGTAIDALVAAVKQDDDMAAKVKAAQMLLDRGWGKAEQSMTVDSKSEIAINITWASQDRLSYQRAEVVEMAPAPAAVPWRAPTPDPQLNTQVNQLLRDAKAAVGADPTAGRESPKQEPRAAPVQPRAAPRGEGSY